MTSTTFGALVERGALSISDGYRAKNSELAADGPGPVFLRAGLVSDTHVALDGAERFRETALPGLASKMAEPDDVVVTTKGNSTGRVLRMPRGIPACVYSPHLSYWRSLDREVIDPGFLYYWSRSRTFRGQLEAMKASTDMAPYLSLVDQRRIRISLPRAATQRAIARILGALDDKIDLNRRTNETLEAMARALFQSWFVDFDPVRAKMEGRQPEGMDAETARLFPSRLDGPVPRGWRIGSLGDAIGTGSVASLQTGPFGSQLHAADYVDHGIPCIMPKDIVGDRISEASIARIPEEDADRLAQHRVRPGDIVFSRRGDVEKHALVRQNESGWLCGTGCLRARFGDDGVRPLYASYSLKLPETREWLVRHAVGATMPNLNTRILAEAPLLIPDSRLDHRFADGIAPLDRRASALHTESRTLAALRDALLPKLLSGELRVPDAEREVAAVL